MGNIVLTLKAMDEIGQEMLREAGCELVTAPEGATAADQLALVQKLQPDAIYCRVDKITKEMMEADANLKVVAKQGVGLDNIDVDYATAHKIPVIWAPGGNANAVAEHSAMLMMMCAVRYRFVDMAMRGGNFNVRYTLHNACELRGKTLGLLGCGRIGQMLARIAVQGFGMKVVGYDPYPPKNPLVNIEMLERDEVLQKADFVSLHMPSLPSTVHTIGYEQFCLMKPTAFFINCARGDVTVEADLCRALQEGKIAGAGLDVFETEPLPMDHPFLTLPNVVVTPHTAATTMESVKNCTTMACQGILDVLQGMRPISNMANRFSMN